MGILPKPFFFFFPEVLKAILGLCWDDEVNTEEKRCERTTVMETVEVS